MANPDLTVGEPGRVLRNYCLPLFGSVFFQQLYNLADSFTAGRYLGEHALAAIGNSYEITLIFLAFAVGCRTGSSITAARCFGAKQFGRLKTAVYTALTASGCICALLAMGGLAFSAPLLRAIRTPDAIFADSLTYLRIYTCGIGFIFLLNNLLRDPSPDALRAGVDFLHVAAPFYLRSKKRQKERAFLCKGSF